MSGGLATAGVAGAFVVPADAVASPRPGSPSVDGYGPLSKAGKQLALPRGFSYTTFGEVGTPISDGHPTPGCHVITGPWDRRPGLT
jgi:hypothetical protein